MGIKERRQKPKIIIMLGLTTVVRYELHVLL